MHSGRRLRPATARRLSHTWPPPTQPPATISKRRAVWQTALFDGFDFPQIYEWLAEALIRVRNFDQAQSILKEAIEKWPKDARFTTRLAALQQAVPVPARRDGERPHRRAAYALGPAIHGAVGRLKR